MIIPAIIGENSEEVKDKLKKVKDLVEWVQIDINDGVFAAPRTWDYPLDLWEFSDLPKVEMHLMIKYPERVIREWASANVDRILVHFESEGGMNTLLTKITDMGVEAGMTLKFETDIGVVHPFIEKIKTLQLMSIAKIGAYGEEFQDSVLEKIRALREKYPDVTIQIDGGVNIGNAKKIMDAGATNLVVGSAIFKSGDIKENIEKFKSLIDE